MKSGITVYISSSLTQEITMFGTIPASIAAPATGYVGLFAHAASISGENSQSTVIPVALTISKLCLSLDVAPGVGATIVATLRKNGVDTAVAVTITGAVDVFGQDLTHSVNFAAGDIATVRVVNSATSSTSLFEVSGITS